MENQQKILSNWARSILNEIPNECPINNLKLLEIINFLSNDKVHYDYIKYIRSDSESLTVKLSQRFGKYVCLIQELKETKFKDYQILNKFFNYWGYNYNQKEVQRLLKDKKHPKPDSWQIINQKYLLKFFERREEYYDQVKVFYNKSETVDSNFEFIFCSSDIQKESYPYTNALLLDNIDLLKPQKMLTFLQLIQSCTHLYELRINWNRSNYFEALGQIASSNKQVKKISIIFTLNEQNLKQSDIQFIENSLLQCLSLEQLHIIWYGYKGILKINLLPKLNNYESLQKLKISSFFSTLEEKQSHKSNSPKILFEDISKCTHLQFLFLQFYGYSLQSEEGMNLGICLGKLKNLKHCFLNLENNDLDDNGCKEIVEGIAQCSQLIELDIRLLNNDTQQYNLKNLIYQLSNLQELSILTCSLIHMRWNENLIEIQKNTLELKTKFNNLKYLECEFFDLIDRNRHRIYNLKKLIRLVQIVEKTYWNKSTL